MEMRKGVFVLSLDTELAWGGFDLGMTEREKQYYENTRECICGLLGLLHKYNIRATFAMVGHLMLDECIKEEGIKHPDLVRPDYSWYSKDWFSEDPASKMTENSIWYGKDILKIILNATPQHEIGSHSFSHIIFGEKGCSYECAKSDVQKCVEVSRQENIKLRSFVFPRNSEGYKDILKEAGFKVYRGNGCEWYKKFRISALRKIGHLIDDLPAFSPDTSLPIKDEYGLYNIPGSMLYLSCDGIRKIIPVSARVEKAKKGIDKAIKRGEVFHLWFHPFNLATNQAKLLQGIEEILRYLRDKIDSNQINNLVMGDIHLAMEE